MNILVIGSGGREHSLCWAVKSSPLVEKLFCAPGNGGIGKIAIRVNVSPTDIDGIISFCQAKDIGFVIIGGEQPLVDGIVDRLKEVGIKAFGPTAKAAMIEGSKGFMKDLCITHGIPTAKYRCFSNANDAKRYINAKGSPIVVKADGLAAGKGVTVAGSIQEAILAVDQIFSGNDDLTHKEVVIEEFLEGEEVSFFALVDGKNILPLVTAQDHKAVSDGDAGPNTGGMGAYSPSSIVTPEIHDKILTQIIKPTVAAMAAKGCPYQGLLYAGLMINDDQPYLIEYNARFGDPECQVLMLRLKSDLLPALIATAGGSIDEISLQWEEEMALCVVLATNGYPGVHKNGSVIRKTELVEELPYVEIFHASTEINDNEIIATGGRVLNIAAKGKTISEAQRRAYRAVDIIEWPEGFCRRDIGWRAIKRENKR